MLKRGSHSMNQRIVMMLLVGGAAVLIGYFYLDSRRMDRGEALAARFAYLSQQGTNSCGGGKEVLHSRADAERMQGSCCGPMNLHSYEEQVAGLRRYADFSVIPPDPYDVPVAWAKEMVAYSEQTQLTAEQQTVYDQAVELSHEGGPCCCKCWHWYTYEGLGKHLIIEEGLTAEQVAQVWNLSDACGGEHAHTV